MYLTLIRMNNSERWSTGKNMNSFSLQKNKVLLRQKAPIFKKSTTRSGACFVDGRRQLQRASLLMHPDFSLLAHARTNNRKNTRTHTPAETFTPKKLATTNKFKTNLLFRHT